MRRWTARRALPLLLVLLLTGLLVVSAGATGTTGTTYTLKMITDKTSYTTGETVVTDVYLSSSNGVAVGSLWVDVVFDKTAFSVESVVCTKDISSTQLDGAVRLAYAGADLPIAAGDGTKLATIKLLVKSVPAKLTKNISFDTTEYGVSNATDGESAQIKPELQNATITVAPVASGVSVTGRVVSYNPKNATTVELKQAGAVKYTATIPAGSGSGQKTQDFTIENVANGKYNLVVTKDGHLTYTITDVVVGDVALDLKAHSNAAIKTITLLAGDMNGDRKINSADLSKIWNVKNYNKSIGVAVDKLTDITGDDRVNSADYSTVWNVKNYNKSSLNNCTIGY